MGLDIIQGFDMEEIDESFEVDELVDCELSRTFCNFMSRKNVVEGEPDLDQIGRMFKVDISIFYGMESYTPEWEMEEMLYDEDNPERVKAEIIASNAKVAGNIDSLISTLLQLMPKLEKAKDISTEINDNGFGTIHDSYYKNLDTTEKGDYIENNLMQDLRSILRASRLAKSKGAKTTFFAYG